MIEALVGAERKQLHVNVRRLPYLDPGTISEAGQASDA